MANGDKAAAAGLATWTGGNDVRLTYDFLNVRGDELAEHLTNGGHPWTKISGKPTTFPAANTSINATASTTPLRDSAGQLTVQPTPTLSAHAASKAYVDAHTGGSTGTAADTVTSAAYARSVSGSGFFQMWMDSGLRIGRNVSSRRYKDEILPHEVDPVAVLGLTPVSYHRIGAPAGKYEYGLIAEDVQELVPELVTYFRDQVDGVRYDLLAVALLHVVKDQDARLRALEGGRD